MVHCVYSSLKRSGMARVNKGLHSLPATHTFIHKWNEPLLPSCRASPHFGRYSFFVPLRVEGWVGLSVTLVYCGQTP